MTSGQWPRSSSNGLRFDFADWGGPLFLRPFTSLRVSEIESLPLPLAEQRAPAAQRGAAERRITRLPRDSDRGEERESMREADIQDASFMTRGS